jgi:tetrapyrrole methylase family protein/MazG family protein
LCPLFLEEVHELSQAVELGDRSQIQEELGDLCFLALFGLRVAKEEKNIRPAQVLKEINEKLIRRHPHVFGTMRLSTVQEVLLNWERLKAEERAGSVSHLPALKRAQLIQVRAARLGFDWSSPEGPLKKLAEELKELRKAFKAKKGVREELGDLCFSLVNLARHLNLDAEVLLHQACDKFEARLSEISKRLEAQGKRMGEVTSSELDSLWEELKAEEDE